MHKAFFGDREREFSLTPHLIPELQSQTGRAIGAIIDDIRRLSYAEIVHTVRLGLIGAGTHPKEAAELVQTYVTAHPLGEVHLLALDILTDLWTGPAAQPINTAAATGDMSAAINAGAA
jgi:hypothetical protein